MEQFQKCSKLNFFKRVGKKCKIKTTTTKSSSSQSTSTTPSNSPSSSLSDELMFANKNKSMKNISTTMRLATTPSIPSTPSTPQKQQSVSSLIFPKPISPAISQNTSDTPKMRQRSKIKTNPWLSTSSWLSAQTSQQGSYMSSSLSTTDSEYQSDYSQYNIRNNNEINVNNTMNNNLIMSKHQSSDSSLSEPKIVKITAIANKNTRSYIDCSSNSSSSEEIEKLANKSHNSSSSLMSVFSSCKSGLSLMSESEMAWSTSFPSSESVLLASQSSSPSSASSSSLLEQSISNLSLIQNISNKKKERNFSSKKLVTSNLMIEKCDNEVNMNVNKNLDVNSNDRDRVRVVEKNSKVDNWSLSSESNENKSECSNISTPSHVCSTPKACFPARQESYSNSDQSKTQTLQRDRRRNVRTKRRIKKINQICAANSTPRRPRGNEKWVSLATDQLDSSSDSDGHEMGQRDEDVPSPAPNDNYLHNHYFTNNSHNFSSFDNYNYNNRKRNYDDNHNHPHSYLSDDNKNIKPIPSSSPYSSDIFEYLKYGSNTHYPYDNVNCSNSLTINNSSPQNRNIRDYTMITSCDEGNLNCSISRRTLMPISSPQADSAIGLSEELSSNASGSSVSTPSVEMIMHNTYSTYNTHNDTLDALADTHEMSKVGNRNRIGFGKREEIEMEMERERSEERGREEIIKNELNVRGGMRMGIEEGEQSEYHEYNTKYCHSHHTQQNQDQHYHSQHTDLTSRMSLEEKVRQLRIELRDLVDKAMYDSRLEEVNVRNERLVFQRELIQYKRNLLIHTLSGLRRRYQLNGIQ